MSDGWWIFLALGAFVGFFSGLLGIGGGAAMVPVLALVFAARNLAVENPLLPEEGIIPAVILLEPISKTL